MYYLLFIIPLFIIYYLLFNYLIIYYLLFIIQLLFYYSIHYLIHSIKREEGFLYNL